MHYRRYRGGAIPHRGRLYAIPQLDAKVGWQIKRTAPEAYTKAIGTISRFGPMHHSDELTTPTSTAAPTSRKEA